MRVAWSVDLSLPKEEDVMQIIISESELESAPEAVQNWVLQTLKNGKITVEEPAGAGVPKNVSKAKKDKAVDATAKPAETAKPELDMFGDPVEAKPVTHEDIRAAGMQFVKATPDGKDKFLKILAKVGAGNIKDVPVEKLAELLAMLAVA